MSDISAEHLIGRCRMRSIVVARLALLLVAVGVCGQTPQKTVPATLLTTIDAQKAKAGDEIAARTSEAVKEDGRMVVPKGAKLMGHVVEVKVRGDDQPSRLVLSFDRAVPDGGKEIPINASIASISRAQGTAAPSNMQQGDMGVPSRAGDAAAAAKQGHSSGSPAAPPARAGTKEHSGPSTGAFTLQQHAMRTVISSNSENVRLASGTQLLMQITLNK
jgi:hypothetical protein